MTTGLTDLQRKKLEHAFHLWDADHNGQIELNDYLQYADNIAAVLKLDANSQYYKSLKTKFHDLFEKLRKSADKDLDGKVSLQEFVDHYGNDFVIPKKIEALTLIGNDIFKFIDSNGDGTISIEEYVGFLAGWRVPEDEAKKSIFAFD
eukprot:TRINITY_DN755_c0_g1_i6.p1 TRINITY_DN755_c0_g1~~TRINITY_DN755_c0_g1_i6.p1  ORF type:complete len:148 (+),score=27.80 TRINITY_DN755_c0_g1_i6:84-527(+)